MSVEDQAHAEERKWREQRELAAARLAATELTLRRARFSRLLLVIAFLVALPNFVLAGALVSGLTAAICVAALAFNAVLLTPRCRHNIDNCRYALNHIQLRYDDAFERMLAAERKELELEPARMTDEEFYREPHQVDERHRRSCPVCGTPGEQDVPHHYRRVVGDNETWISCKSRGGYLLWRFDPHAAATTPPAIPASLTFSCPLCGAQGHRAGLDAHDIAVPEGHERQILGESEVWIICPSPMSWTTNRWRYEWV